MEQELLSSVKLIKMYAWEAPFSEQIKLVRKLEAAVLRRAAYMQVISVPTCRLFPCLSRFTMSYVLFLANHSSLLPFGHGPAHVQSLIIAVIPSLPVFAGMATFLSMFALREQFSAANAFSILAVYNVMRGMIALGPLGIKVL